MHWLARFNLTLFAALVNLLIATPISAQSLSGFEATFKVKVLYFTIGNAYQSLSCAQSDCTLKSTAKPPKWAERYINEAVKETIQLQQTTDHFHWKSYYKHLTRHKDGKSQVKETRLQKQGNHIQLIGTDKHWPYSPKVFDQISLPYGLQFARLNQQSMKDFFIQDHKGQEALILDQGYQKEVLDLPIDDDIQTERFQFHNGKINAELWLAPKWQFFPVKIKITDKEKERTITLELSKLKRNIHNRAAHEIK